PHRQGGRRVTLTLMSYNIRHGGAGREHAIAAVIRACAPDLVVLQEATRPEVVERLAVLTSMTTWGAKRGWSLGFLSRVALSHHTWQRPFLSRHAFLELALRGSDLRVIGVHLSAVHAAWTERRRTRELRALLAAIRAHAHGFHVLAGDFNTLAPGEELD